MKLVIVHSHFRPGGVRRVIELATPHLVAHWPDRIRAVVLSAGEAPDPSWLRGFRRQLRGIPVKVIARSEFGYVSELGLDAKTLHRRVKDGVSQLLRETANDDCVVWAHNLGLGRNLYLARELAFACHRLRIRLVAHHHDWWFENRWHHFAAMRQSRFRTLTAVALAVLPGSPAICHMAINQSDTAVLERHFPRSSGWLPNPVEPEAPPSARRVEAAAAWLRKQLGEQAPVWLLPCRLLRRKNILEALLLTRWLRPEAWLVTTGGVSAAEEQVYADTIASTAQKNGWRLSTGILRHNERKMPSVPELLAASEAVMFTSLQEGFGLPYLEAAAAKRPLVARRLSSIAPDLRKFGFTFHQWYKEVLVDPVLFDWRGERERQTRLFARWRSLMPEAAVRFADRPAMLCSGAGRFPIPFSRLTLTAQLEVLTQPLDRSWERCVVLNPFLRTWRDRARQRRLKPSPWPASAKKWLGGQAYARRFLKAVASMGSQAPAKGASQAAQAEFLRIKLREDHLYPLLWDSST